MNHESLVRGLRDAFRRRDPGDLDWRREQLTAIRAMLDENVPCIGEALSRDLGKSALEGYVTEIGFVRSEAAHALKHLGRWARPRRTHTPVHSWPGRSRIVYEPLGVTLILGAWNYPLQLTLAPLVAAIAAGNSAVIKPSEMAPATSDLLEEVVPRYLDTDNVAVVPGGVETATSLLEQRFDKIFYTGNSRVARIVMTAAARHLTPVILELGGKSPCIVDRSARLDVTARRVVFGKFVNAGQTCVAPDYVLVEASVEDAFLDACKRAVQRFYGPDAKQSPDYARIVNDRHFRRLVELLGDGTIVVGGSHDAATRYIAPTILRGVSTDAAVMQEEVFGPILPVLPFTEIGQAVEFVNRREKPLALYVYAENRDTVREVSRRIPAGGMCVNDSLMHLAVPGLPFGGVGESGMGKYHGEWGFRGFSNAKAVLDRSTSLDASVRYPPYNESSKAILRKLLG
jgi:aldehyde dehydrogenase (NAD+)